MRITESNETDASEISLYFEGSKRYPELRELIQARTDEDQDCPHCNGTGVDPMSIELKLDNIRCYCGGLGWIPKEENIVPRNRV